jgi:CheY-like chemotaxis protein
MNDRKILVVEDDRDSRTALCLILEALGYQYISASSGKEALALVAQDSAIDLALVDIMMPEMDGYQVLAELRKIPELSNIPVIMVTAKDADAEVLEGYKYGADYYITKPYTAKQIEYGIKLYME